MSLMDAAAAVGAAPEAVVLIDIPDIEFMSILDVKRIMLYLETCLLPQN
jgi:hypothetical protein